MEPLSLRELEDEARRHLAPAVYDYFAGGADDEVTMRANETAFAQIGLVPRVLRGSQTREPDDALTRPSRSPARHCRTDRLPPARESRDEFRYQRGSNR
jgi:hypothetical protein